MIEAVQEIADDKYGKGVVKYQKKNDNVVITIKNKGGYEIVIRIKEGKFFSSFNRIADVTSVVDQAMAKVFVNSTHII